MTEKTLKTLLVRLPVELKEWLEKESARTMASQNSEIVRCIRASMEKTPGPPV